MPVVAGSAFRMLGLVAVLGLVGCAASSTESPADNSPGPAEATDASPSPNAPVKVVVADEKQFQDVVDSHRGKVVLVDFWATWCLTCVEHFPETVKLHNEHAADGLAAVTVSFDDLANQHAVEEFLAEAQAGNLDNLLSKYDGVGTEVPKAFGFEGVLPHFRLYDRTGKLRYRWDEPPADLKEKVVELLAEKPAE